MARDYRVVKEKWIFYSNTNSSEEDSYATERLVKHNT